MKIGRFEDPVVILLGLGIPTEIKSVLQAYQVLMDWRGKSDHARDIALKACRAALAGTIEPETAKSVFVTFAKKHDLIAPPIAQLVARDQNNGSDPRIA